LDRVGVDVQGDRSEVTAEANALAGEAVAAHLQDAAGKLHELAPAGIGRKRISARHGD
ncbi:MAG: hypothetical protein QOI01_5738, partial [Mycobacterium sp.]|nr:hypothetical protein [Mycobacterium sp.]